MKKLIFFLSFLITANIIFAQAPSNRSGSFVTAVDQFTRVNQLFGLPIVSDTLVFTGTNGLDSVGSKIYVRSGVNVGEWVREYDGVSQNKWVKSGSGGGGSGCTTFYVTSDSLYFVRDSCGVLDSTQIVSDGSSSSGVQSVTGNIVDNTDPLNPVVSGVSQTQLDDSTAAIRTDVPEQFNPIAGSNMSLSGTYPNITFNASGSTGVASVTGLNTDNTNPANPIVNISVDGTTITGAGTPASPLVSVGGGGSPDVTQIFTGSSTVTIADSTTWLIINPSSISAAMTITMPASPTDKQNIVISFGGTIVGGAGVVTALTISPNAGQTIIQASTPSYIQSGETISYKYNSSNTSYYRIN